MFRNQLGFFSIRILGAQIVKDDSAFGEPLWFCFHDIYMYEAPTLPKLIWKVLTEWKDERNIVG